MRDDDMKPGSPNYRAVSLDERWQVLYWTTALHCGETNLRAAVAAVGDDAAKIRVHVNDARMLSQYKARPSRHNAL